MLRSLWIILGALSLGLLAACATPLGLELGSMPPPNPGVSAFNQALYGLYKDRAVEETSENDHRSADLFARKGKAANAGETVLPEEVAAHPVHESELSAVTDARARLMGYIDRGAREIRPEWTAKAQVNLDCWIEEAAEKTARGDIHAPQHVAACKSGFEAAMAKIGPFLPPEQPMQVKKAFELMPEVAGPPAPAVPGVPDTYLVFFDWNKSDLTPEALNIIRTAAANAKKGAGARIDVTGHADRSGPADYNMRLSKRRADAVKAELVRQGVPASAITVYAKGETEPLVPTPDGVREPQNRRAQIVIRLK